MVPYGDLKKLQIVKTIIQPKFRPTMHIFRTKINKIQKRVELKFKLKKILG